MSRISSFFLSLILISSLLAFCGCPYDTKARGDLPSISFKFGVIMKTQSFLLLTVLGSSLFVSSCSLMVPERSFTDEMEREESFYNPGRDFPVVSGDTGEMRRSREDIMSRTPGSERQRRLSAEARSIEQELSEKEDRLEEDELEAYARDKRFLPTDSDKLYYLNLMRSEREVYISTKKQDMRDDLSGKRDVLRNHSIHSSELYLGMGKADVIDTWGKPARVEIAGNPTQQNERWSFIEDGNLRQVYFEGGRVQGWALDL